MANTYSQIYLQFVFAAKNRSSLINPQHKEELHKYITGLVSRRKSKLLAVNSMPDHTHLFVGFKPVISISDFMKEIKVESNEFINSKKWIKGKFGWQEGYGDIKNASSPPQVAPTEPDLRSLAISINRKLLRSWMRPISV